MKEKFAQSVLDFYDKLGSYSIELPKDYKIINPFADKNQNKVKRVTYVFYKKYYNDNNSRFMILGSSPARRGTAITGIPFEDANHLEKETGIQITDFNINKSSSNFLYEVIEKRNCFVA